MENIKKNKKILYITACSLTSAVLAIGVLAVIDNHNDFVKASETSYELALNSSNTPSGLPTSFATSVFEATPSRYASLDYFAAKKIDGAHAVLQANTGYISNKNKVTGITSITVTFATTGTLVLNAGIDDTQDYEITLTSGTAVPLTANWFKLSAKTADVTITGAVIAYRCAAPSLGAGVTNLAMARADASNVTVSYTAASGADHYRMELYKDNVLISSNDAFESGTTVAIPEKVDADYSLKVKAVYASYTTSDWSSKTYNIVYRNALKDSNENTWTGWMEDGKPYGTTTLVYKDGTIYVGTFRDNWTRLHGRNTFTNNMYYEGDFVNDAYDGDGFFTWSTTGNYQEGNYYEGKFSGGNTTGCVGTFHWTNTSGIIYWTGVQGSMGTGAAVGQTGTGEIVFANNSIYTGDVLRDSNKGYIRYGKGSNIWTVSENCSWITGGDTAHNIYGFVGSFDALNQTWVYGQGVWYFKNADGTPYGYITGIWNGGTRTGAWSGTFNVATDILADYQTAANLTPVS